LSAAASASNLSFSLAALCSLGGRSSILTTGTTLFFFFLSYFSFISFNFVGDLGDFDFLLAPAGKIGLGECSCLFFKTDYLIFLILFGRTLFGSCPA